LHHQESHISPNTGKQRLQENPFEKIKMHCKIAPAQRPTLRSINTKPTHKAIIYTATCKPFAERMQSFYFFIFKCFSMSVRRRPRCRFVGRYCVFRSGGFVSVRLFLLPSGLWLHLAGGSAFFSSSIAPPF